MIEFYFWEYSLNNLTTWLMGVVFGVILGAYIKQKERNEIAIKIFKLLNKERPKPDIFDCINILNNLQEGYAKELEFNTLIKDGEERKIKRNK